MRALLLFNPHAGRRHRHPQDLIQRIAAVLRCNGFNLDVSPTKGAGTAAVQASTAVAQGFNAVFAAGGDGTVNEVLQGVAGTPAALAVLPFGSANVFARDLGLSMNPLRAAQQYTEQIIQTVAVGQVDALGSPPRYFLAVAGAGPDGLLAYRMVQIHRRRWGRGLYYLHALRLYSTQRFPTFTVRYRLPEAHEWRTTKAISAMTVRVGTLGGVFHGLVRGPSDINTELQLILVRGPGLLSLPLWFLTNWCGLYQLNPLRQALKVAEFRCETLDEHSADGPGGSLVRMQIDGEFVSGLPFGVRLVQNAVHLLLPQSQRVRRPLRAIS